MKKIKLIFILAIGLAFVINKYDSFNQDRGNIIYRKASYLVNANYNPADSLSTAEHSLNNLLYQGLFRLKGNLDVDTDIAESWSYDNKSKTYQFVLKKNVHFTDGTKLTATNVKKSLDYLIKKSKNASQFNNIKSIVAKDDFTVFIEVEKQNPPLIPLLASPQAKIWKNEKSKFIGSGYYKIDSLTEHPTKTLHLIKNSNFSNGISPEFDKIDIIEFEADDIESALERNLIDDTIDLPITNHVKKYKNFDEISTQAAVTWLIALNSKSLPYNVRKCLIDSFDNREFVERFLPNHDVAMGYLPVQLPGSAIKMYDISCKPNYARKTVNLRIPKEIEKTKDICSYAVEKWKNINIDVNCLVVSFDELLHNISKGEHEASLLGMSMDVPSMDYFFSVFEKGSKLNFGNYSGNFISEELEKSRESQDRLEQQKSYQIINQYIYDQAMTLNISYPRYVAYVSKCVSGLKVNVAGPAYTDYTLAKWRANCQ